MRRLIFARLDRDQKTPAREKKDLPEKWHAPAMSYRDYAALAKQVSAKGRLPSKTKKEKKRNTAIQQD